MGPEFLLFTSNQQKNILADSLSRLDFKRFFENAPETVAPLPDNLPEELWPASKIWQK